jgi:hypothetical protein
MKNIFLLLSFFIAVSGCMAGNDIREGDILFQYSGGSFSKAIQRATHSAYSHVGVVLKKNGELQVFEAVQPVKYTPLKEWIARGEKQHYVVKRLRNHSLLTAEALAEMRRQADGMAGKSYDIFFHWSDERLYCSEVVWKLYQSAAGIELGEVKKMREYDLRDSLVQLHIQAIHGNAVPYDEPMISPGSIYEDPKLLTVEQ